MNESLVAVPRFEPWVALRRQEFVLDKSNSSMNEPAAAIWLMRADDHDFIDDDSFGAFRRTVGRVLLNEAVIVDRDIHAGVPVLRGTRITIAQIITEIADGETVEGFADEYDIDGGTIKKFLEGLAIHLDQSFTK